MKNLDGLRESKSIRSWNDLREYGIDPLTGESCGYSMRLLCDLDQNGVELIREFLGGTMDFIVGSNWNSTGATSLPHIASVMLSHELLKPLAAYVLLREGYHIVIQRQYNTVGCRQDVWDNEFREIFKKSGDKNYRIFHQPTNPAHCGRHVHMMSGRAT